jgi:hypothetical protein
MIPSNRREVHMLTEAKTEAFDLDSSKFCTDLPSYTRERRSKLPVFVDRRATSCDTHAA